MKENYYLMLLDPYCPHIKENYVERFDKLFEFDGVWTDFMCSAKRDFEFLLALALSNIKIINVTNSRLASLLKLIRGLL